MANDPVPAITEAEATGETAEIFADLRNTLGVNVVNLVWRHIATFPEALAWAWSTLRPIYVSGAVGREASRLRSELVLHAWPVWPISVLRCVAVDATSEVTIRRVLASYNLILRINRLGDQHQGRIIASMYRHLAHWPGFLALCYSQLAPLAADGSIAQMIASALALADDASARLQGHLTVTPRPESVANIRLASMEFIEQAISKMVPIAKLIEASLAA